VPIQQLLSATKPTILYKYIITFSYLYSRTSIINIIAVEELINPSHPSRGPSGLWR
jgi:hypothetical protein